MMDLYNESDPRSIQEYAQRLIGQTFRDVVKHYEKDKKSLLRKWPTDYAEQHENKKRKGGLGDLIEECHFHYKCNNDSRPDFEKAGVELKVTPYKKTKKGVAAKERLSITMINYCEVINETFETSHVWEKSKLILLIYYLFEEEKERLDYTMHYARLFSPPKKDLEIIKHDFETIVSKIREGKAHELSESDTLYLGAATKAADSNKLRAQPYSNEKAKPRAFSFKNSYMTYVLNNYMMTNKNTYETIVRGNVIGVQLEKYVVDKIGQYEDWGIKDICKDIRLDTKERSKNFGAILAYRILGIKGNHAEEFEKAGIVVKTIRIGQNGKIKEHMSFPTFKFEKLVKEEWDESKLQTYFSEKRLFFVVYKVDENGVVCLKGGQFWNMPYEDLQTDVKSVWKETKKVLEDGLIFGKENGKSYNNFPKASDNRVCHVRPHGKNAEDTYKLPRGGEYTKQSFWLNNTYILSQLERRLVE